MEDNSATPESPLPQPIVPSGVTGPGEVTSIPINNPLPSSTTEPTSAAAATPDLTTTPSEAPAAGVIASPEAGGIRSLGEVVGSTPAAPDASSSTSSRVTIGAPSKRRPTFTQQAALHQRARLIAIGIVSLLVIAVIALVAWYLNSRSHSATSLRNDHSYAITSVPLSELRSAELSLDNASQLSINGQLRINNSFVLTPTDTPANPLLGQFYLNGQNKDLYYYNGSTFVNLATGGDVTNLINSLGSVSKTTPGNGLAIAGGKLNNTGVLSLQGTANQINLSGSTGNVTIGLPQDIAPSSTPTFAGVQVGSLTARASDSGLNIGSSSQDLTLQGANTSISSSANGFTTHLTFANPSSNNTLIVPDIGGTICTTAGNCGASGASVSLQPTSPGAPQTGNANLTGTIIAGQFQGDGSALTNVNAAELGGQTGSFYQSASNINTGTLADGRLSANVTLQGNTFNHANQLVQLDNTGVLPALSGVNLVNLNASNLSSGTLPDGRLSTNVTLQGNTFNGNNQLVQLNGSGQLPAVSGAQLTNLNGSNITTGTVADARLSTNVTLQGNTFNGNNQLVQLNSSGQLPAVSGVNLTNLNGSNITSGTVADNRLSGNVTLAGNTFNGASQLVQLTSGGLLPALSGANLTSLNATNITSGTLADGRLSVNVTVQGNTFNGNNQLVQLNGSGLLPAVNGSQLTNLNATNITSGTLAIANGGTGATTAPNARTNLGAAASGANGDITSLTGLTSINNPLSGLTIGNTGQSLMLQGGSSTSLSATSGSFTTTLGFTAPTATRTITLPDASGIVCLSSGNCSGTPGGGANTSLSNLASVALNVDLQPASDGSTNLGTSSSGFGALYVADTSNTFTYKIAGATTTQNKTITIPTFGGTTATLCLSTGNCSSAGGGVTTPGGTTNTIPVYSGSQIIGNSIITQDSGATTVTITGALSVTAGATVSGGVLNANGGIATGGAGINTGTGVITGDGSGLTNLNGSNIATGTVADNRLSANVTLQGNTFNGNSQLVKTTSGGLLPVISGANVTNLNGSNITTGTVADARLTTNVTLQGNTFNGANQLVQLDAGGVLPALSGANLTNLNATNITTGTLSDSRLSTNVTKQGNTFNGANQLVQLDGSSQLPAVSGAQLTNLNGSNITTGTVADGRLSGNVTLQGNTFNGNSQLVQTTSGGLLPTISGANVTNLNATNISSGTLADGRLSTNVALLNGSNVFSGSNNFKPTSDSATAFRIQNALGTTTLFNADTTGSGALTFGVPSTFSSTSTFNGTVALTSLGAAGSTALCLNVSNQVASCSSNPNSVTLQQAYNASTSPQIVLTSAKGGLVVQDNASPIGGNLFAVQSNAGGTTFLGVTATGTSIVGTLAVTGTYNTNTFNSSTLTFGAAGSAAISSAAGQSLTVDSGTTGGVNVGTGANAKAVAIGNNQSATTVTTTAGQTTQTLNTTGATVKGSNTTQSTGATGSNAAFQVQNAAGGNLFQVDTANNNIVLGGNNSGALQPWTTNSTTMPAGLAGAATAVYNGYIYEIAGATGFNTGSNTTYYAKLNSDGSVGTWTTSGNTIPKTLYNATVAASNGYLFMIGGYDIVNNINAVANIYEAQILPDGSVGSWTNLANNLPQARDLATTVVANGYVYVIGGYNNTLAYQSTVYYAPINANGTFGTWTTSTTAFGCAAAGCGSPVTTSGASSVVANGYVYVVGGNNGTEKNTVYYGQLNASTGNISSWQTTTALPTTLSSQSSVVSDGYLYVLGGSSGGSSTSTVYYAKLNSDGTVGAWATNAYNIGCATAGCGSPVAIASQNSDVANGYIYILGGTVSSSWSSTIYYTSTQRIKVGGSLDLVGLAGQTLNNPGGAPGSGSTGGSITAGDGTFVGNFQVQGQANFGQNVSIGNNLNVDGSTSLQTTSTTAFNIQSAAASVLFTADTSGQVITISGSGNSSFATLTLTNSHFKSTQGIAPTIAISGVSCGTSPTTAITAGSTDSAGSLTLTTGTGSPVSGCATAITFKRQYGANPKSVLITGGNIAAAGINPYVNFSGLTAGTGFNIFLAGTPAASTAYTFYYWVIE